VGLGSLLEDCGRPGQGSSDHNLADFAFALVFVTWTIHWNL